MLHQLRCFIMLTQTLHYTEAARRLYLSQPSLSYAISTLEKELDVELFQKQGRSITMTRYAEELLPFAMTAIRTIDAGLQRIKEMKNPKNIRLGYIYSISYDFLPSILNLLPQFTEKDEYTFSFYQGQSKELIRRLKADELDLAFCPYYDAKGISREPIFSQEIFVVVKDTHPLARKSVVKIADLEKEKFALINTGTNLRKIIDEVLQEHKISPQIVFEADECNSLASFVASGLGISFIPKIASLEAYNLSFLRVDSVPIKRMIYLIWKTGGQAAKIGEIFREKLHETYQTQLSSGLAEIEHY